MFQNKLHGTRKRIKANATQDSIAKGLFKLMNMNKTELSLFNEKRNLTFDRAEYADLTKKLAIKHKVLLERINLVRKQMILNEVCQDIMKVHKIIIGLIKYDNICHLNKDELHQRQLYRQ